MIGSYADYCNHTGFIIGQKPNSESYIMLHPRGWKLRASTMTTYGVDPKFLEANVYHVSKNCIIKKDSHEDILTEAQRRYPIGTEFNNGNILGRKVSDITVSGTSFYKGSGNAYFIDSKSTEDGGSSWTVYSNGKWADIIAKSSKYQTYPIIMETAGEAKGTTDWQSIWGNPARGFESITQWDTSKVTDIRMTTMFNGASNFDESIFKAKHIGYGNSTLEEDPILIKKKNTKRKIIII